MTYSDKPFATPADALAHYGVKGMRWGVRKSDSTAGGSSSSERSEARKQKKMATLSTKAGEARRIEKEMDELGLDSPYLREMYGRGLDQSDRMFKFAYGYSKENAVKMAGANNKKAAERYESDLKAVENGKMTRAQKNMLIGGLAVTAVLGAAYIAGADDRRTANALPGERISPRNFFKRYNERSTFFSSTPLNRERFSQLDDNDVTIPKGTVFKRLTAYKDESLDGRLYTTHTENDHAKYQGLYGPMLKMRTGARQLYISNMTVGESIRSPSHKKRVQAYVDLVVERNQLPEGTPASYRKMVEDRAISQYNIFARNLVGDDPVVASYFQKIQDMGYNALMDDNDAGMLSDSPMILLNPRQVVSKRSFTPLTTKMEKEARKRIIEVAPNTATDPSRRGG